MAKIDLSKLEPPKAIDMLDIDKIFRRKIDIFLEDIRKDYPDYELRRSDPIYQALREDAFSELRLRQIFNEKVKSQLLAFSSGSDLDHLAAKRGVIRKEDENDQELRTRILEAIDSIVAGQKDSYEFWAERVPSVISAFAYSPDPKEGPRQGRVNLVCYFRNQKDLSDNEINARIKEVQDEIRLRGVRDLTDWLSVISAKIVNYSIDITLYTPPGADSSLVEKEALKRLLRFIEGSERIGRNISKNGIIASVFVPGVTDVNVTVTTESESIDIKANEIAILKRKEDQSADITIKIENSSDENSFRMVEDV